jgi:hypothetical protein
MADAAELKDPYSVFCRIHWHHYQMEEGCQCGQCRKERDGNGAKQADEADVEPGRRYVAFVERTSKLPPEELTPQRVDEIAEEMGLPRNPLFSSADDQNVGEHQMKKFFIRFDDLLMGVRGRPRVEAADAPSALACAQKGMLVGENLTAEELDARFRHWTVDTAGREDEGLNDPSFPSPIMQRSLDEHQAARERGETPQITMTDEMMAEMERLHAEFASRRNDAVS